MDMDIDFTDSDTDDSALEDEAAASIEGSIPASIDRDPPACVVCRYGNNKTARFADLRALLQHAQTRAKARDKESRQRKVFHEQLAELLEERLKDSLPTRLGIATGLEAHSKANALAKSDIDDVDIRRSYDKIRKNRSTIDARNQMAANVRQEAREEKSKLFQLQDNLDTLKSLYQHHQELLTELAEKANQEHAQFQQRIDELLKQKETLIRENNAKLNNYATKFNRQGAEYTPKEKMADMRELLHLTAENMRLREDVKEANSEMQKLKEQNNQVRDRAQAVSLEERELRRKHAILASKTSELDQSVKLEPMDNELKITINELNRLGINSPCSEYCLGCAAPFLVDGKVKEERLKDEDSKDTRRAMILQCGCIDYCISCVEEMKPTCRNCGGVIKQAFPLGRIFG